MNIYKILKNKYIVKLLNIYTTKNKNTLLLLNKIILQHETLFKIN